MKKQFLAALLLLTASLSAAQSKDFIIQDSNQNQILVGNGSTQNVEIPSGNLTLGDNSNISNFFNQTACGDSEAVKTIYPNGSYLCTSISTTTEAENLSETLAAGNVANQSIKFEANDISSGRPYINTTQTLDGRDIIINGEDVPNGNAGNVEIFGGDASSSPGGDYGGNIVLNGGQGDEVDGDITLGNSNTNAIGIGTNSPDEWVDIEGGNLDISGNNITGIGNISGFFDQTACADDEAIKTIYPNGSYSCNPLSQTTEAEGLNETLAAGNTANTTIDLDGNKIDNVGELNVSNSSSGTKIAEFKESGVDLYQPLSIDSSGGLSVANGVTLTDSTSNTIESYSTMYLSTSSGSPTDIVLNPTGVTGVESNLDMAGNNITNCDYINGFECDSLGVSQDLAQTLSAGNKAGDNNINMTGNNITDVRKIEFEDAGGDILNVDRLSLAQGDTNYKLRVGGQKFLDDGFEDGTLSPFSNTGGVDWTVNDTSEFGDYSARAGSAGSKQTSELSVDVSDGDKVVFRYKYSKDSKDAFFDDGTETYSLPETGGKWIMIGYEVPPGSKTLSWKGSSAGSGEFKIDNVRVFNTTEEAVSIYGSLTMNTGDIKEVDRIQTVQGVEVGAGSNATNVFQTAVGRRASATAYEATAYGYNSSASGVGAIAIGTKSSASDGVAIGDESSASGGIAFGFESSASGVNSVALGDYSSASADGAVALGSDSVADESNTVEIGSSSQNYDLTLHGATVSDEEQDVTIGDDVDVTGSSGIEVTNGNVVLSSGSSWIGNSNSQNDPNIEFEGTKMEFTGADRYCLNEGSCNFGGSAAPVQVGSAANISGDLNVGGSNGIQVDSGPVELEGSGEKITFTAGDGTQVDLLAVETNSSAGNYGLQASQLEVSNGFIHADPNSDAEVGLAYRNPVGFQSTFKIRDKSAGRIELELNDDLKVPQGGLVVGSNTGTGISSGDINASEIFYDTMTAKSPVVQCSQGSDWCEVSIPENQSSFFVKKGESFDKDRPRETAEEVVETDVETVKELETLREENERQEEKIESLNETVEGLKAVVCEDSPGAEVCR
jgi:hypothetical protein